MKSAGKLLFLLTFIFSSLTVVAQKYQLIVGTYTGVDKGEGIYLYDFDAATGKVNLLNVAKGIINPSYLSLSADKNYVYSVNENGAESAVSSFKINKAIPSVNFLNTRSTNGKDPCYIINDQNNVLVANYSSGNINVFGKNSDGSIGQIKQIVAHTGKGFDTKRQEAAHAHQVIFSPDKKHVLSNDLGTDKLYVYTYSPTAKEPLTNKNEVLVAPGAGPRHLTFSPSGDMVYVIGELDGNIYAYKFSKGNLTFQQKISTTNVAYKIAKWDGADIHTSPDGKFLYASLRGQFNTISLFSIGSLGKLSFIEQTSTLGIGPRNFTITPDGKWLLAAHQKSNNVVIFKRNLTTGKLKDSGGRIEIGSPVFLQVF